MFLARTPTCCNAVFYGDHWNHRHSNACCPRPAPLFVKQLPPLPSRRLPRHVASLSSASTNDPDKEEVEEDEEEEGIGDGAADILAESSPGRKRGSVSSKWASLFEAASGTSSSSSTSRSSSGDADSSSTDAWFDKIFPKTSAGSASTGSPSKLTAQQEKSIQQLQSLVKTLGVATKNSPPPPARKNKPGKIRKLPVDGGVVDPVPFASILKKLQAVRQESWLDPGREFERSGKVAMEVGLGKDLSASRSEEEESISIQAAGEVEEIDEEEQGQVFSKKSDVQEINDLSKLTVPTLRGMAKSKGLSGYSRLKKDDLVHLLANQSN